jgi:hypothetical protein
MIRFYKINMETTSYLHPYLSTHNIFQLLYGIQKMVDKSISNLYDR